MNIFPFSKKISPLDNFSLIELDNIEYVYMLQQHTDVAPFYTSMSMMNHEETSSAWLLPSDCKTNRRREKKNIEALQHNNEKVRDSYYRESV